MNTFTILSREPLHGIVHNSAGIIVRQIKQVICKSAHKDCPLSIGPIPILPSVYKIVDIDHFGNEVEIACFPHPKYLRWWLLKRLNIWVEDNRCKPLEIDHFIIRSILCLSQ